MSKSCDFQAGAAEVFFVYYCVVCESCDFQAGAAELTFLYYSCIEIKVLAFEAAEGYFSIATFVLKAATLRKRAPCITFVMNVLQNSPAKVLRRGPTKIIFVFSRK